jgi:hypothetical protein
MLGEKPAVNRQFRTPVCDRDQENRLSADPPSRNPSWFRNNLNPIQRQIASGFDDPDLDRSRPAET